MRLSDHQQRQNAEGHGQRQGQQNRERVHERFKLRGQHDVHEDERQRDRDDEVVRGAVQFLGSAQQFGAVAGIHVDFLGESDSEYESLSAAIRPATRWR